MEATHFEIGKVVKTHGYKGGIKVSLELSKFKDIESLTELYFKEGISYIPYFLNEFQIISDHEAIVHFDSIDSKESAQLIVGYVLYVAAKDFSEEKPAPELDFNPFVGYSIVDQTLGEIGQIAEIIEHPHQIFAIIMIDDKEVLIPMHKDLVQEIKEKDLKIVMNLPDGILDL